MCSRRAADNAKGSYILLIKLPEETTIAAGRLGPVLFRRGHYAYVGSALGGLKQRLDRHLRAEKKLHWHIDYLLEKARIDGIVTCETDERTECAIANALSEQFESVPGFGSSDCRCHSHLFFSNTKMMKLVMSAVEKLGLRPALVDIRSGERYLPD
jgi:Uri superfamily endonuclease